MNREGVKEASQNKEQVGEVFSDAGQSGNIREYEFFVPEAGPNVEPVLKPGEKKQDDNQKSELIDFFLDD